MLHYHALLSVLSPVWRAARRLAYSTAARRSPNGRGSLDSLRLLQERTALLECTQQPIFAVDRDGNCTFANRACTDLLGWSPEELTGRNVHLLAHHHRADGSPYPAEECPIHLAFQRGERAVVADELVWRRDGAFFPAEYSVAPVIVNGETVGAVVALTDIGERKRLEEQRTSEQQQVREVLESITDCYIHLDRAFRFVDVNERAAAFLGRPRAELLGQGFWHIFPQGKDSEFFTQFHRAVDEGVPVHFEAESKIAVGVWFETHAYPSPDGLRVYYRDVTARKQAEAALQRKNAELSVLASASSQLLLEDDPREILHRLFSQLSAHLGLEVFFNHLLEPDGSSMRLAAFGGVAAEDTVAIEHIQGCGGMCGDLAQSGCPLAVEDVQQSASPGLGCIRSLGLTAYICHPLIAHGRLLGTLSFGSRSRTRFDADEIETMRAVCDHVATALERARLLREAETARAAAERAAQRSAFVASAGAVLASSLDYEQTLRETARLLVPELGDWCVVDLFDEVEPARRVAVATAAVGQDEQVRYFLQRPPLTGDPATWWGRELRSGRPVLLPEFPAGLLEQLPVEPQERAFYERFGICSALAVPLIARGRVFGVITLFTTVSGRRYDREQFTLAQEIARRAGLAVDNARLFQQAQESVRLRDEFVASAAHDLKNPLSAVKGQAQILLRRLRGGAPQELAGAARLREGLESIETAASRMTAQVNELLDVARLRSGQPLALDRRPTNLVALTRRVVELHSRGTDRHRLRLDATEDDITGDWDAARLERVAGNLVANAIKYSPSGGDITIRVGREDVHGAPWAVLAVCDQGIGIPAADVPLVFERFYRASNVAGQIAGSGIGLAGARHIVEQHGGAMAVESREGEGSCFTVRLPLHTTATPEDTVA